MTLRGYAVYDRKALIYNAPFFAVNDGSAIRLFQDLASDNGTTIGRHPGDFQLYFVSVYDDQTGRLEPVFPIVHVTDALPLVGQQADLFSRSADGADYLVPANGRS